MGCSGCVGGFDKAVAHNDCSAGPQLPPTGLAGRFPPGRGCNCTEDAVAYSKTHPGRLPVYLPWHEPDAENSTLVGYWYSFPGDGECAFGVPVGTDGCTWRR